MIKPATDIVSHGEAEAPYEPLFQTGYVDFASIPPDLVDRRQWAVWRQGAIRSDGRYGKPPYSPITGYLAESDNPATWSAFEQSRVAYIRQDYDGLGFMLSPDDPYTVLDFDKCRNLVTGEIAPDVLALVARFDSYTEVSPSGTGLHVYIQATPAGKLNSGKKPEVYSANHFITVTGQRLLGTPTTIEGRQEVFDAWYQKTVASRTIPNRRATPNATPTSTDEAIVRRARRAKNGDKFTQLWEGDWSGYPSQSEADQALVALLAFHTRDTEQLDRLFRRSGLYHRPDRPIPKWDERRGVSTYGEQTIEKALEVVAETCQPRKREEHRITYPYDWQQRVEAPGWREGYLQQQANEARDKAQAQIEANETTPLVIKNAPGVGKTTALAPLGQTYDIAWIAQRHDMYENVARHGCYLHIEPATPENCPDAALLNLLASYGHNVYPMHRRHDCDYYRQHEQEGSAFYQVAHVPTSFPKRHQAAIVDELALPAWLNGHKITRNDVEKVREHEWWLNPNYEAGGDLLRALTETMLEAAQRKKPLYGKALMDTLDRHSNGKLAELLTRVERLSVMEERPRVASETDIIAAQARGKIILPFIVQALQEDLPKWKDESNWNSRAHLDSEGTLHIIRPLRFQTEGVPFPVVISDATADERILSLLFGQPVRVEAQDITPPPHMRHIAVRARTKGGTIKRYGKFALADGKCAAEYRERVIRELRYLLARENPEGTLTVGLITYQKCENALGEALGIPENQRGHFWGVRGSNRFKDCDILLVVGTPTLNLSEVEWMARALYADDLNPIDMTQDSGRYQDERLAGLLDHLVNSELTQVAHRNRPIRFDGRVVITLTSGEVDFLPITEMITEFGDLPTQKRLDQRAQTSHEQEQRLEQAAQAIQAREERVTGDRLSSAARVSKRVALAWMRGRN